MSTPSVIFYLKGQYIYSQHLESTWKTGLALNVVGGDFYQPKIKGKP